MTDIIEPTSIEPGGVDIDPTDEQRAASFSFCNDHSSCGPGYVVDESTVAGFIAEREQGLRGQLVAMTAERDAAKSLLRRWMDHDGDRRGLWDDTLTFLGET